jgi:hypothetical protein
LIAERQWFSFGGQMDKRGNPTPLRFWNGLEDAIHHQALIEGRSFAEMVNHLCDRGLYFSDYKFPFHKPKFISFSEEGEENNGR